MISSSFRKFGQKRKVLTGSQMVEFYGKLHLDLEESYWDHVTNQNVCKRAMTELKQIHISKKSSKFVVAYTHAVREVYSHANANLKELLFVTDNRDTERIGYWEDLSRCFDRILLVVGTPLFDSLLMEKMGVFLSYASLFSLYKDVAERSCIAEIYNSAALLLSDPGISKLTLPQKAHLKEMEDNIHTTFSLRYHLPDHLKQRVCAIPTRHPSTKRRHEDDNDEMENLTRSAARVSMEKESAEKQTVSIEYYDVPPVEDDSSMEYEEIRDHAIEMTHEDEEILSFISGLSSDIVADSEREASVQLVSSIPPFVPSPYIIPKSIFHNEHYHDHYNDILKVPKVIEPSLTPFDPEEMFNTPNRISHYGRRALFDDVKLPVIGARPKGEIRKVPSYRERVEDKIVRAVLEEKPVSPMAPPPVDF